MLKSRSRKSSVRTISAIPLDDIFECLTFRHHFNHLDIRGLGLKELVNFTLILYNNEGYNVDEFTLRKLSSEFIDRHCLLYYITKQEVKPQLKSLTTVVRLLMSIISEAKVPITDSSEYFYHSFTSLFIKGYNAPIKSAV